jgi:alpha-tubulin suppressor-like RCC1 family protein
MKKTFASIILFFALAVTAQESRSYIKIAPAEYGFYALGSDKKVYHYSQEEKILTPFLPDSIKEIAAGLHHCGAITADGKAYILYRPGLDGKMRSKEIPGLTDAVSATALWSLFVFIKKDGTAVITNCDDPDLRTYPLQKTGPAAQAVNGNQLLILTREGEVYQYNWKAGKATAQEVAATAPVRIPFPGKVSQIAASRNDFMIALIDGLPWGWSGPYSYWIFGLSAPPAKPIPLKDPWKLKTRIKQIVCGDNTCHFIDANDNLFGLGNNAQGEVGNGKQSEKVSTTKGWDFSENLEVTTPVQIGIGRKYRQICKGNTLSYYTYAQETNGMWNSWGRNKAGVLGNGIFDGSFGYLDDKKPNIGDILSPRRVDFPVKGKLVNEKFYDRPGNYPPQEAKLPGKKKSSKKKN